MWRKGGKKHRLAITQSEEGLNYLTILIKDLDDTDEGFSERKYRTHTAFLIGVDEPKSSRVNLVGVVIPSGKGKEASMLSYEVQLLETDPTNYLPTERDIEDFHKYFRDNPDVVNDLVSGHAPRIVGKNRIKEGIILVGHSPSLIQLEGDIPQRALLRLMQVGPTKTAKSATNKAFTDQYRVGEWASGESASRAGLTYFVDIDSKMIEWGLLPRNDLSLCVVNGLHIFRSIEFLEALESMKIVVNRAIKGSAPCRTRILADANPESSFKDVRYPPMYRCVELLRTPFFHGRPEMITRFDLFFVTRMNDVSQENIDRGIINPPKPKIPAEIVGKHMKWTFSLHPDQIRIGTDQEEEDKINNLIAEANSKLLRAFGGEEIPIVHRGSFYQILRVALAYAALHHSTSENDKVLILRIDHVEEASSFLWQMCSDLELAEFKELIHRKDELEESEVARIFGVLDQNDLRILDALTVGPCGSGILEEKLGGSLTAETIRKYHYPRLKSGQFIEVESGGKASLTPRGIKLLLTLKFILQPTKEGRAVAVMATAFGEKLEPVARAISRVDENHVQE